MHLIGKAKQSQDIYLFYCNQRTELEFSITEFNHGVVHFGRGLRSSVFQPPAQSRVDLKLYQIVQRFIQLDSENLQEQTEPP